MTPGFDAVEPPFERARSHHFSIPSRQHAGPAPTRSHRRLSYTNHCFSCLWAVARMYRYRPRFVTTAKKWVEPIFLKRSKARHTIVQYRTVLQMDISPMCGLNACCERISKYLPRRTVSPIIYQHPIAATTSRPHPTCTFQPRSPASGERYFR